MQNALVLVRQWLYNVTGLDAFFAFSVDFLSNYNQEVDILSLDISDENGQEKILKE